MDLARDLLKTRNEESLPVVEIGHPVGGISSLEAEARVSGDVVSRTREALTGGKVKVRKGRPAVKKAAADPDRVVLAGDEHDAAEEFHRRGWTDGLPIVVPTGKRVEAMCGDADPGMALGSLLPRGAPLTLRRLAVNAVMAGCLPEHMPVLTAAAQAVQEPDFNLYGVQTTTHSCTVLAIVHGPVARALGMNCGHSCFGSGNRANAAIGRALRLTLQNVGGAVPGETDKATQGSPAKFGFCFAENEEMSPWEPFRFTLGYDGNDSCVTVVAAEPPHNINDHGSTTAESVLTTIAHTMSTVGNNNMYVGGDTFVVLGPEHARTIAAGGYDRADVRTFLYERSRVRIERIPRQKLEELSSWGGYADKIESWGGHIPLVRGAEEVRVLVAGGAGKHSAWIPTFGASRSVTRKIAADPSCARGEGDCGCA